MNFKDICARFKTELLSGITVGIALVPEAIAFAFIAQVNPLVGLYAAFIVCLITSLLGGRPGMISGATGALAIVMVSLVIKHGPQYLFAAIILMGAIQMFTGLLKLGKYIKIVPHSVMLGFVNGLATVVFVAQFAQFKTHDPSGNLVWLQGQTLYIMIGLVLLTMAILQFLPKITKIIPSALAGILIVSGLSTFFHIDTPTVGDMASIAGSLPSFSIPTVPFTWETLKILLPYSVVFAGVGLLESLLTQELIDEITETKSCKNQECLAQGLSNLVSGFFGAMGGCAMIGQSMINISSGARRRLSGIAAALFLIGAILFGAPVIEKIPLAALVGVMFMVAIKTFGWSSLRIIRRIPKSDAFVILLVSITTVLIDLASAVVLGVVVSALVYAWNSSKQMSATVDFNPEKTTKTYTLHGPLFFSSVAGFRDLFDPRQDPQSIIVDFKFAKVWDHSGIEALQKLESRYQAEGKQVTFQSLSKDCEALLLKTRGSVNLSS